MDTILFDIDGTLMDSNYQHAIAWSRAFRRYDVSVAIWRIHRSIGMGGDRLVAALAGDEVEQAHGDELRSAHSEEYEAFIDEVQPLPGAKQMLRRLSEAGVTIAWASSGKRKEVDHYLEVLEAKDIVAVSTSSDDAESSKPAPDILEVALSKLDNPGTALMVGDSTWDFRAAQAAGVAGLAVRTGGFSPEELREAGAEDVVESLEDALEWLLQQAG